MLPMFLVIISQITSSKAIFSVNGLFYLKFVVIKKFWPNPMLCVPMYGPRLSELKPPTAVRKMR